MYLQLKLSTGTCQTVLDTSNHNASLGTAIKVHAVVVYAKHNKEWRHGCLHDYHDENTFKQTCTAVHGKCLF